MSVLEGLTDAVLYRDYWKSDERKQEGKVHSAYAILGSGTVDVNEASLNDNLRSLDTRLINCVVKKSQTLQRELERSKEAEEDC